CSSVRATSAVPSVGGGYGDPYGPVDRARDRGLVHVLALGALRDDGDDATGGEAVDAAHLEQGPGLHLEVEDAEPGVLVDRAPEPAQQAGVGRGLGPLLALVERVGGGHDAHVVGDAEVVG